MLRRKGKAVSKATAQLLGDPISTEKNRTNTRPFSQAAVFLIEDHKKLVFFRRSRVEPSLTSQISWQLREI